MEFAGYSTNSEGSRADCRNYLADEAWPPGIRSVVVVQPFASLPRVANFKPGRATTAAWRLSARSGRRGRFRVGYRVLPGRWFRRRLSQAKDARPRQDARTAGTGGLRARVRTAIRVLSQLQAPAR